MNAPGAHQTFEAFLESLAPISSPESRVPPDRELAIRTAVAALAGLHHVSRAELAGLVREHPEFVPVLGLVVGLSQEQLKNHLKYTLKSASWLTLARKSPEQLIGALDSDELGLINQVVTQLAGSYTLADVLIARAVSRERASRAVRRGRKLEDLVEQLVKKLDLNYATRTRFVGANDEDAPCDLAIPSGGRSAQIVVAVKGFDSTGSKLSAAVDEIDLMARKRRPTQYVYAVVDGIGWLGRQSDLKRLFAQFSARRIDGLYTLATLAEFEDDLTIAAKRLGLK